MRLHHLLILLTHPEGEGYYINLDLHQLIPVCPQPTFISIPNDDDWF